MDDDSLLDSIDGGIATLTLNQPGKLNPLDTVLQFRLREAVARVQANPAVRVLVITGTGRAFCAGANLPALWAETGGHQALAPRIADAVRDISNPLITELRQSRVPVVAAVNGLAAGAGVGLALAADIVIAARSAYFYLPFVPRLGILPDLGTTWFLPRLAGKARATALALLGDRLTAETAERWGLIWQCVDDPALTEATRQIALALAALPDGVALELRRALDASETNSLETQLRYEADQQRHLLHSPDFAEGVSAFLARRDPHFPGRAAGEAA